MSNADGSLVMATYGTISSEFNALSNASWLTTAYSLATCAVQPITGKLSDIYGRKRVLLASYVLFAVGSVGWYVSFSLSLSLTFSCSSHVWPKKEREWGDTVSQITLQNLANIQKAD